MLITLHTFLQAIHQFFFGPVLLYFSPGRFCCETGTKVSHTAFHCVRCVRALQTVRTGEAPKRQLINTQTIESKQHSWCQDSKMNDFHNI